MYQLLSRPRSLISLRTAFLVAALLCGCGHAQTSDPDQLMKQAVEAQQRGDYQEAISDYRKLLKLTPNAVEAKVNLGAALVHVGQFDEGIAMYKSALPLVSQKNAVRMNIALAYYKKGDFKNAEEQLLRVHKAQPSDVRIAVLLADTDVHLAKFADAVALLEPLENANSQNTDLLYVLGSAMIGAGRRRDGAARVEKVAQLTQNAEAYALAGETMLQLNEYEHARNDFEAALRLNPNLPGIYTLLGNAQDKMGDVKQAEQSFREALKLNPDDFEANVYLGTLLSKRRALDQAKPYLERAIRLNPSSSLARYEMAIWESTSGQYQAAADRLEGVIKDDPNWLEAHVELASLYYRLHRRQDGLRERKIVERLTAERQATAAGKQP